MRFSRLNAMAIALTAMIAVGCNDHDGVLASVADTAASTTSNAGLLTGEEARAVVSREALNRLDRGDRAMFDSLAAVPTVPRSATAASYPGYPGHPSTWGPARIYNTKLIASIGDVQFVYGEMTFGGTVGKIDLSYDLFDAQGRAIMSSGPRSYTDWNLLAPLSTNTMKATLSLYLGYECGRKLGGRGGFSTFYVSIPFSITIPPVTIPPQHYGSTYVDRYDTDEAPPCPPDREDEGDDTGNDDSGDSGGPSGNTYTINMCHYIDWYNGDGTFLFTEFVGCETISIEM